MIRDWRLASIVGAGLGTNVSYLPINAQQNPPDLTQIPSPNLLP